MEISIVLGLCLIASIVANIILVRLASWQSRDLTVISDSIGDLVEIIENYGKHLKDVYSLDAFEESGEEDATQENEKEKHVLYAGSRRRDS